MAFLDRIAKAVSDTVDKGRRELDQMARINRIRGEIREIEREIQGLEANIQTAKVALGEKAMVMLKEGTLSDPELQPFVEQVEQAEQGIADHRAAIAEKEAAIEEIKAEDEKPAEEAPPAEAPTCPQCGAAMSEGAAFCAQCGAKIEG